MQKVLRLNFWFLPFYLPFQTQLALTYDAVTMFGMALHKHTESIEKIRPLSCDDDDAWTEGLSLINEMRTKV